MYNFYNMLKKFREIFRFHEYLIVQELRIGRWLLRHNVTRLQFWWYFTDFKGTTRKNKIFGFAFIPDWNNFNIWKIRGCLRVVVDYTGQQISNFLTIYTVPKKIRKFRENILTCSLGVPGTLECFDFLKWVKILLHSLFPICTV